MKTEKNRRKTKAIDSAAEFVKELRGAGSETEFLWAGTEGARIQSNAIGCMRRAGFGGRYDVGELPAATRSAGAVRRRKNSGVGREGGDQAPWFFTGPKNVCIRVPSS